MARLAKILIAFSFLSIALCGCKTSEIKEGNAIGMVESNPTGTTQSGYADGKGDSIGGGGAAPALDVSAQAPKSGESTGH